MNINSFGVLYVVATPIGNLQDISFRAVNVLKTVDHIVAEDTRHSQFLLQHYSIGTPVMALHEHNERERTENLLKRIQTGKSIALISDAGTPLISDPGYFLVREARSMGIKVVPLPGPCAAIAALSVSGLATDRFLFEGFLPAKTTGRVQRLDALQKESRTVVFYEAPHRIVDLLEDMQTVFGAERQVVIARELTKVYETVRAGALSDILAWVKSDANQQRGELVVMVEGQKEATAESQQDFSKMLSVLLESLPLKQAVELTVKITGQKKNIIYDEALKIKGQ